ncbi:DUF4139 domain-containing protein [Nitratifractor sp.]
MKNGLVFVLVLAAATLLPAAVNTVIRQKSGDLSLTIYNRGLAFVHERRQAEVGKGRQKLVYEGVAHSVLSESVIPSFEGMAVRLYSQNYIYDLVSLPSMLRHSIGKEVSFLTNGRNPSRLQGTLLADDPSVMIREKSSGTIYTLEKPSQVLFPRVPEGMITRPSLVWEIETPQAGKLGIDLKYLTKGISWKSDYVLDLNRSGTLDLVGWITVNNRSGVSYPDAKLTFLAGDVNRAAAAQPQRRMLKAVMRMAEAPAVKEEAFAGYHIYKIPFRTTLRDKQQKQIPFLNRARIAYRRYGKAFMSSVGRPGVEKMHFRQIVEFDNTRSNHLGIPLPAGIVRMYSKDRAGESRFIGESRIGNLPTDETVRLTVGTLFDAVGERKVTRFVSRSDYRSAEILYTLHNRGEENLTLKIEERIPTFGGSIKLRSDCQGICSVKKLSAFVREFTIRVPAKKSYSFHSEFEIFK